MNYEIIERNEFITINECVTDDLKCITINVENKYDPVISIDVKNDFN